VDVVEAIRTTGACRYFKPDPVSDEVLELEEWYLRCWKAHLAGGYRAGASAQSGGVSNVIRDADHLANHLAMSRCSSSCAPCSPASSSPKVRDTRGS
jgi:hypothetical protein